MDILKHLTSPAKRSYRPNLSNQPTNPFTAMTAEELMGCLPELTMSVVSQSWVPAMETELKKIKGLLQEAIERQYRPQADLENFGSVSLISNRASYRLTCFEDVNDIALSARNISRTYFDAMQRVRPLADRDAKAVNNQLELAQAELQTALGTVEENKNMLDEKENLIKRLRETIAANIRTFGGFIRDHVGSRLDNLDDARTKEILELIEDQQRSLESETDTPGALIRISETDYNSLLYRDRKMHVKVGAYTRIAQDQLEIIKSQSADLDKRVDEYGNFRLVLEKRQHQIVELESKIEQNRNEVEAAKEIAETLNKIEMAHRDLGKKCSDLEWTLQSTKNGYQKQLQDKDREIFALRQQLGDAVMEAASQKTAAKFASTQPAPTSLSSRFKKPLHLGKRASSQERDLPIHARRALLGRKLPLSQSMLSLNTSQANLEQDIHPAYRNTPSPLSDHTTRSGGSSSDRGSGPWLSRLSGLRMHPPNTSSASTSNYPVVPPRKEPLRLTVPTPTIRPGSTLINREKALPKPPPLEPQDDTPQNDDDTDAREPVPVSPQDTTPRTTTTIKPRSRILSGITELSFEDDHSAAAAATADAASTHSSPRRSPSSNSDQDAIRSSLAIWQRIHFDDPAEPDDLKQQQQQQEQEHDGSGSGSGSDAVALAISSVPASTTMTDTSPSRSASTSSSIPTSYTPPPFSAPIPGSRYYPLPPGRLAASQSQSQSQSQSRPPLLPLPLSLPPPPPPPPTRQQQHRQPSTALPMTARVAISARDRYNAYHHTTPHNHLPHISRAQSRSRFTAYLSGGNGGNGGDGGGGGGAGAGAGRAVGEGWSGASGRVS